MQYKGGDPDPDLGPGSGWDDGFGNNSGGSNSNSNGGSSNGSNDGGGKAIQEGEPVALAQADILDPIINRARGATFIGRHGWSVDWP